jgi:1,2-diacylglycerol 3-beta-glucosyltransferase
VLSRPPSQACLEAREMPEGDGDPLKTGARRNGSRADRGPLLWSVFLNALVVFAIVIAIIPIVALVRGVVQVLSTSQARSGVDTVAYGFAFTGLFLGAIFFTYAIKYYLGTAIVLVTTLLAGRSSNGNGNAHPDGDRHVAGLSRISRASNGNGSHIELGYHPFVSIHVAAYNEKRVIERLLTCLDQLDYPEYEVVVVDDSTDQSVQILQRWANRPRFKIGHRGSRLGFKGGALREALKVMDPRTEYVVIFDADSMPFPDSIERFLPYFYQGGADNETTRRDEVAAVQSYQWHVLNKSESWLTEAVRAEYAGSYMVERPFQDAVGSLKMIAGTAYMIRADILREVGWGTSLTEDWELTLKLYARGYKVVYTPWAETPAECVSTFSRLARQRMRWAEGHTFNVRKWFLPIMLSPSVSPLEKLEFAYDAAYYLQAALFALGTFSWLLSELVFRAHVPGWTAALGWSLIFSNVFALPLMNLGGLILEDSPARDLQGVIGALVLSFALVPFQGWAALKGLVEKEEGPWFRTPKTGNITDPVKHLRRLHLLRRWFLGPRSGGYARKPLAAVAVRLPRHRPPASARGSRLGWLVIVALVIGLIVVAVGAVRAPVTKADAGSNFELFGSGAGPTLFSASASNNTVRTQTFGPACVPACPAVWTAGVGAFPGVATATTSAQTIFAGTYSWQYWTENGADATVNWRFEYGDNVGCTVNPVTIASFVAVPLLRNVDSHTAVLGTTATNVNVPAGKFLCISITWNSGGPARLQYGRHNLQRTNFTTPQVIFIPEYAVGLVGLALVIPVSMKLWLRRRPQRRAS